MPRKKNGKEAISYSSGVATNICEKIIEGQTLAEIGRSDKMPHPDTIKRWMLKKPEFREMVIEAREIMGIEFGAKVARLAKRVEDGEIEPHQARVAMNGYMWSASKLAPHVYGEKSESSKSEPQVHICLPPRDDDTNVINGSAEEIDNDL